MTPAEDRVKKLEEELRCAKYESARWKLCVAYLASCEGATLEGLTKSTPKCSIRRHIDICKKAVQYLNGQDTPITFSQSVESATQNHTARCERSIEEASKRFQT
jgi:hypothetical protein